MVKIKQHTIDTKLVISLWATATSKIHRKLGIASERLLVVIL